MLSRDISDPRGAKPRKAMNLSPQLKSMTGRLILFYVLSIVGMMIIVNTFLYFVLLKNTNADDCQFLMEKSLSVSFLLKNHPEDTATLNQMIRQAGVPGQIQKYYARILDDQYRIYMESPDLGEISDGRIPFPEIHAADKNARVFKKWLSPRKKTYLLSSFKIAFGMKGKSMILQLALDNSGDAELLKNYWHMLLIVLFLGILGSSVLGIIITKNGLHPLGQITETVQRMTASQLHERIGRAQWPKELEILAKAFDGMMERLEDSFTRISALSADMAHELRTPINNLMGETEVMLARIRPPEEYKQALESNLEEYEKLSRMIDGILFLARSENHHFKIQHSQLDVSKEIAKIFEFYETTAKEKGVTISCFGSAKLNGDSTLFRRAISNLFSNALQYTSQGGKIHVSIQNMEDHSVQISITDTGIGIPPKHLSKIFDRFYRADNAKSLNPQGAGLGLAIVKTIVELHGGIVEVQSELAKGSTVLLSFPAFS